LTVSFAGFLTTVAASIALIEAVVIVMLVARNARGRNAVEQHKAFLRAMPDLVFLMSKDGVYLDYHASNKDELFVPPEQFLGKNLRDILPPEMAEGFFKLFEQALTTNEPAVVEYTLPINGENRTYEARIVVCDHDKLLSICRDITSRARAEEAIQGQQLALEARDQDVRNLVGRLIVSQEAERARIARDLHDDVGQRLALLSIDLDNLAAGTRKSPQWSASFQKIKNRVAELSKELHVLSRQLHPSKIETLGLVSAIDICCREVSAQHKLMVKFTHQQVPADVPGDVALSLYRIVQEALHNVVKHSGAALAEVRLAPSGDDLELLIADKGRGFKPGSHEGLGLVSMKERAHFLRGRIAIQSTPSGGTRIRVRVPLTPPQRAESGQQIA